MTEPTSGVSFSVPYEIAVVRPLRQTTIQEREEALKAAYYNTELVPQEMIYVDLKTDSGVSSFSTAQLTKLIGAGALESGMEMAPEGSKAFVSLAEKFQTICGFPYVVPVAQGRAAERIWLKMHVKEGSVVPGNMLFPSTRIHIESNGGTVLDVISEDAHDLSSERLFKGNIDISKLEAILKEQREKIACVYVELCVNSCGGHPVSLENLQAVKSVANVHKVPVFLDACRILENSYLIKQRESGYQNRSIQQIVHETCACADGLTMSALKDLLVPAGGFIAMRDEGSYQKAGIQNFLGGSQPPSAIMEMMSTALQEAFLNDSYVRSRVEQINYLWRRLKDSVPLVAPSGGHGVFINVRSFLPHVPAENFPGEALAAFIYQISGIRVTKGPPLAASQTARGVEFLRLAVPARRYLQGHMDDVAEAVQYAYSRRNEIKGLKKLDKPGRSRFEPSLFAVL
ncbi:MAG TPA: tryptophanase [Candidatus Acidoferrales bacterium]|nr:tryptophanase [Candidatus Acidoferrales bacterium]